MPQDFGENLRLVKCQFQCLIEEFEVELRQNVWDTIQEDWCVGFFESLMAEFKCLFDHFSCDPTPRIMHWYDYYGDLDDFGLDLLLGSSP